MKMDSSKVFLTGCLGQILAALIGAAALIIHFEIRTPVSPYQVQFSRADKSCADNHDEKPDAPLLIDVKTGELLYCSAMPSFIPDSQPPGPHGAFGIDDVARVAQHSRALASVGGGLSKADQQEVRALAAQIGREHGWTKTAPTWFERLTLHVGIAALVVAGALLLLSYFYTWTIRRY